MKKISFVIPCYRSENTISKVVDEVFFEMSKLSDAFDFEIILVNDCSPDNVWHVIQNLANSHPNIVGVDFSKNFGQHAALLSGYSFCHGDYVVSLDDDGQTPLESLKDLIDKLEEGFDVVYAYYREIKQNPFRRFGSWMAKKMGEVMLNVPKDLKGSSFYIARKYIIDEMIKYKNAYPYIGGLVCRATRNATCIPTNHRNRLEGESGYSFRKLFFLWMNGFTAFSIKPLQASSFIGVFFAIIGMLYAVWIIIRKLFGITQVEGWSSIIALLLIIGGLVLLSLGLIGEYIGRIYICINNAPQYIIKEVVNADNENT